MPSDEPIFEYAEYLKPIASFPHKPSKGKAAPIPLQRTRYKQHWRNWLYDVVKDVNPKGVGTIKVYRDGRRIAQAGAADMTEADRIYYDTVDAAQEATRQYVATLEA